MMIGGKYNSEASFTSQSSGAIRRLRAMVQMLNTQFSEKLRQAGHMYFLERSGDIDPSELSPNLRLPSASSTKPVTLTHIESLRWVVKAIIRNWGRELQGNFNPLIIGELFWEQSARWGNIATDHIETVVEVCRQFLQDLLRDLCPKDVQTRLSSSHMEEAMKSRRQAAVDELAQILDDLREYPINYNHYHVETMEKCKMAREHESLANSVEAATSHTLLPQCNSTHTTASLDVDRLCKE